MQADSEADRAKALEHLVAEDARDQRAVLRPDRVLMIQWGASRTGRDRERRANVIRFCFMERHGEDVPSAGPQQREISRCAA